MKSKKTAQSLMNVVTIQTKVEIFRNIVIRFLGSDLTRMIRGNCALSSALLAVKIGSEPSIIGSQDGRCGFINPCYSCTMIQAHPR